MNTLKINSSDVELIVKQFNKFRLDNKNHWYQIEINTGKNVFKCKAYNTWIQIFRKYENDTLIYESSNNMDSSIKDFKNYLTSKLC